MGSLLASIGGPIIAGGIVVTLTTIGAGAVWWYNTVYSAGKKAAKLNQARAKIDDLKRAGEIASEQKTVADAESDLNRGGF
jgi:hypothetical protein